MALLERIFRRGRKEAEAVITAPAAPPPIDDADRAELARTRARLAPKWAAVDGLLSDFRATDKRLRIDRR